MNCANKTVGAIVRGQVSVGWRGAKDGSGRKGAYSQVIELRRASTVAAQELGHVNRQSRVHVHGVSGEATVRVYDTKMALSLLQEIKKEFAAEECEACSDGEYSEERAIADVRARKKS